MKIVGEGASERRVFAGRERGGDRAGVAGIFDGLQPIDSGRKKSAGFRSRDFEMGNEKNEMQLCADGKHLALEAADNIEPAVTGRRGIVRMAFELGANLK